MIGETVCMLRRSFEYAITNEVTPLNYIYHFRNLHFEKAYCLYRLNNHTEALKIIDQADYEVGYHLKELKAQILYRIENYADCVKVYRDIIKNTNDEYEDERQTNLTAALAFLDKSETVSH